MARGNKSKTGILVQKQIGKHWKQSQPRQTEIPSLTCPRHTQYAASVLAYLLTEKCNVFQSKTEIFLRASFAGA